MLSQRWDTAGRWCIYALLLIVFVGPFLGHRRHGIQRCAGETG